MTSMCDVVASFIQRGRDEATIQIILGMYREGIPFETIVKVTQKSEKDILENIFRLGREIGTNEMIKGMYTVGVPFEQISEIAHKSETEIEDIATATPDLPKTVGYL